MLYVDLSLKIPANQGILTYHVPDNIEPPLIGARVIVSLVNRKVIGYAIKIHSNKPEFKTSPILEILDPVPLISEKMLKLAEKTAYSYVCTIGEVLNCMLPAGIKQTIRKTVVYKEKKDIDEKKSIAIEWLKENKEFPYESFKSKFNLKDSQIKKLVDNNELAISYSISTQKGPKIIKVLKLDESKKINLVTLTPKEIKVLQTINTFTTAPSSTLLAKMAKTSIAPINQLKKKGLLLEVEEQVYREVAKEDYYKKPVIKPPELNSDQTTALKAIKESYSDDKKPVLIRGVTCSGKTEIYLRWVKEILDENKSAIVLVPEISLTPQMLKRFTDRFGDKVSILHSKLSDGERFDQWEKIRTGKSPVVVGARSAVFAPVPNLGTIILDEEGEPSFKQGESPRYHAREVAAMRCEIENALLVMGSATPTIDSFQNCLNGNYHLIEINKRVGNRLQPEVHVVDMRNELVTKKNRSIFSEQLYNSIKHTLSIKKQTILYLNRRGFSSFVFCRECGEPITCPNCKVSMTYHDGSKIMRCHYCGSLTNVPNVCPKCGSKAIKFFGAGTQRVEAEAHRYFPNARIQRLDSDSVTTKGSMEEILDRFGNGDIDILIGTQMVAKGLDFPNVTLVGILAADSLLRIPDFRASERNFSLLAQVAGRAGRGDTPGEVILQTYSPEHHSIKYALTEDYSGFFQTESKMRKEALFPPFIELASFLISGTDLEKTVKCAKELHKNISIHQEVLPSNLFGPSPASLEKINNRYRFQIMLKMNDISKLTKVANNAIQATKKSSDIRIAVDINPFFMI